MELRKPRLPRQTQNSSPALCAERGWQEDQAPVGPCVLTHHNQPVQPEMPPNPDLNSDTHQHTAPFSCSPWEKRGTSSALNQQQALLDFLGHPVRRITQKGEEKP